MALNKQMEMFEDGGLMDEGGTVDPVSGNDVPPGSTQEEVRDDIPAQLSEGEFVFPADVVRFIGLSNLMRMRQEAKMGLKMMDEMGQMGNSEEATMPDDLPFDINDLDMEDDDEYNTPQEFAVGGMPTPNPNTGVYYNPAATPTTGVATAPTQAASQQFVQPLQPQQAAVPTMQAYQPAEVPTFKGFVGENVPGVDFEYVDYTNEAGNVIKLRKSKTTGELLDPVPEGYTFVDPEATKTEEVATTPTTPQTTSVRQEGEGENRPETRGAVFSLGTFSEDGRMGCKRGEDYFDFNVSFDTRKEGSIPGTMNALGLVAGLATGKGVPDGTIATLEYGGTEIKVGANEYNAAREDRTGNKAQELIDRFKEKRDREVLAAKTLAAEYGIKYRGQTLAEMAKATNAIDAERKKEATKLRKEAEKAEKDAISFEQLIGSGADDDKGDGRGMDVFEAAEAFQREKQDSGEGRPDQSSGSSTGGYYDFNQGGLASKPKPKVKKKMKKGGLASKK